MRSALLRRLMALASVALPAASLVLAGPASRSEGPQRFIIPSLDGTPVILESPVDGLIYSAWTYRSGAEYDIAVSIRELTGAWSRPLFFGRLDGVDQKDPALAIDASGHVYLAYASSDSGQIFVSALSAAAVAWSTPLAVSPEGLRAAAPALLVVGDRLVVAFRHGSRVALVDLPLAGDANTPSGIQDGPDPIGGRESRQSDDRPGDKAPPVPFGGGS